MTANRKKMLARLQQYDSTVQELADVAGVAYQTAWRWVEQQTDLGNVEIVAHGNGREATRFGWTGGNEARGETLLYRAADYLAMRSPDVHGMRLSEEISAYLAR